MLKRRKAKLMQPAGSLARIVSGYLKRPVIRVTAYGAVLSQNNNGVACATRSGHRQKNTRSRPLNL